MMTFTSGGDEMEQAIVNAGEARALHVAGIVEDGVALPIPTPFDRLVIDKVIDNQAIASIEARQQRRKARINVMMDSKLLKQINAVASNRSWFLSKAAREALG